LIRLSEALKRNKTLIQPDQREYQKDLENKFTKFTESLQPLLLACKQSTIIETTLANNKRYIIEEKKETKYSIEYYY
jgi:hypothetical protein